MISLNEISTVGVEVDLVEPYCTRAKLDTGPFCNYNCNFCYYQGDLHKQTPLDVIIARLEYLYKCGITEVDLSGGESSLRPDWFELLDACANKGMKISTVSNGYKFADRNFLEESVRHGLSEILFSLHGYNGPSHNEIVKNKHGFTKIMQAIKNAKELGVIVRINCVVTSENVLELSNKFANLMLEIDPLEVNFLTLNAWGNNKSITPIPYSVATHHIKLAIDRLQSIKYLNVRYTPYCYMLGYEKYVCNTYQHIYDVYDWNMAVYSRKLPPGEYKNNPLKSLYSAAAIDRVQSYRKETECASCKFFYICDGIENAFPDRVIPVAGDKIKEVNFYRKGMYSENKRSNPNT